MECHSVTVEQRSDEWDALRRCRITASRLGDVMAGKETKRYREYQREIVMEMLGKEYINEDKPWFEHGKRLEPLALGDYQFKFGQALRNNVFLIHHKYDWLSATPDFMTIKLDEGGEIKCRALYSTYRDIVSKCIKNSKDGKSIPPSSERFQIQGALWLTGFDSWWYVNYYNNQQLGKRKLHRIAVPRDDALIEKMESRCVEFMKECYEKAGLA